MKPCQQRRNERSRLIQAAKLRSGTEGATISCMIRDISDTGARLRVPLGFDIPDVVYISAPAIGRDREARIVWRDASSIGVAFAARGAAIDRA